MKFKKETTDVDVKGTAIKFDKNDFMAVKGNEKSRFNGITKIVPKNVGSKLIELKKATEVKGKEIEIEGRENVSVKNV